jgi:hypothetical protein
MPSPRRAPYSALLVVLVVYLCFEFHEYFEGKMKLVASALLSCAFIAAFATLTFRQEIVAWARRVYGDGVAFRKRAIVAVALVLGTITHWHAQIARKFYIQMRVPPMPANAVTLGVYALFVAAFLFLLVRPPARASLILWLALAWGLCLRVLGIVFVKVDPAMADMLFCIDQACKMVLSGHNPYGHTFAWNSAFSFPTVYFPFYWLPFLGAEAVGVDLRWASVLGQIGFALVFLRMMRGRWDDGRFVLLLTLFALMPDMIFTVVYRQTSVFWMTIALFVLLAWQKRWLAAGIAVSVLAAMQVPAGVILFVYVLYIYKTRGLRPAALQLAMSIAIIVVSFVPFLSAGVAALKHDMFDFLLEVTRRQTWMDTLHGYGLLGALPKAAGHTRIANVLQGLAVMSAGVVYLVRGDRSFGTFLRATIACYVLFLWSSPFVYIYYWFPTVVLALGLFVTEAMDATGEATG